MLSTLGLISSLISIVTWAGIEPTVTVPYERINAINGRWKGSLQQDLPKINIPIIVDFSLDGKTVFLSNKFETTFPLGNGKMKTVKGELIGKGNFITPTELYIQYRSKDKAQMIFGTAYFTLSKSGDYLQAKSAGITGISSLEGLVHGNIQLEKQD